MIRVLIPTDFSENAFNAIRYAMELLKYQKSEFLVVHCFADEVYANTMEMSREFFDLYKEKTKEAIDRSLQKVIAEMLEISPNPRHEYNYKAVFASLVDTCNDMANKEDLDLIIMGTKGKTDNRDITFGSQALQVAKYVKCPVLMVPVAYHKNPPQNVLFPTDYIVPYKRRELKLLNTLTANFAAQVQFLYLSRSKVLSHRQEDNKRFLDCCLEPNKVSHAYMVGTNLTETINRTIEDDTINLLVMVNSRHSYMESLLQDSTIDAMGLNVKIPFLILQNLPR
ncbi:universal stress protein [Aureisphaera galaxeae]|uniref:universal stress protein n=1 Tax=Aureisphaera galaxeae TaxID=1538023 RepID=UPI002350061D|nr:universal stress protein [Aureisphaera galaxeae]MDC8003775.1 universal stress protein [Aureisphaera galaxeae]